jgi:hypothetical protein
MWTYASRASVRVYRSRPIYVEKRNKRTKKNCAPSWLYLQDYTAMHGQQNIKFVYRRLQLVWDSAH